MKVLLTLTAFLMLPNITMAQTSAGGQSQGSSNGLSKPNPVFKNNDVQLIQRPRRHAICAEQTEEGTDDNCYFRRPASE